VRARSLAEGVADILREEPFGTVVLELPADPRSHPPQRLEALVDRIAATLVLVRPRPGAAGEGAHPFRQLAVV
jgi:hypothetical protein